MTNPYTVAGVEPQSAEKVAGLLQQRLVSLLDLQLTLKHIHWNVVGPNFIAVHEMLDPQVDRTRSMSDELAERIATLGYEPMGTPGYIANHRGWDDYRLGRAQAQEHLAALDVVYSGVVADHRKAIAETESLDPVTQGVLVNQAEKLELFQWFVRAHLEDDSGRLRHGGTHTEQGAANSVR